MIIATTIDPKATAQMTRLTYALGKVTSYSHDVNDLVKITDALNCSVNFSTDAIGRTIGITDPLGNRRQFAFDSLAA